ncbi:protein-export chaperone SecB [Porphyromonas circumdentaria]|uniref:protein-export chaperone SecB n=1 Tax=Porphyromonas circumdentaria TaxID=29524 RepID=UPI0026DD704F|nr:protein-export chaperone SecB [Porphyromonas circumdentaria]MDO4722114.1 protein-export chaperone SecB [Porphyromonas circumdentaria]
MDKKSVKPASFQFKRYLVTDTSVRLKGREIKEPVQIGIEPEGDIDEAKKTFLLTLRVLIRDEEKNLDFSMVIKGFFEYEVDKIQDLLPYISTNAPAILFPYVRAYISNITALGGMPPIILPTWNLEGVGKMLREKLLS